MPTPRVRKRSALAAVVLLTAFATHGAVAQAAPGLVVPSGATIVIHGHGNGHGHGMSQYGAQGAAKKGRATRQILSFYYPHTAIGKAGGRVTVLITETIGQPTKIEAQTGLEIQDLTTHQVRKVPTTGRPSRATLWKMSGDGTGGTTVSYRTDTWHVFATLKGNGAFVAPGHPLTLLEGHNRVEYRGSLRSMGPISKTTHRITVNRLSLENYVAGVVPREMPSTWLPAALRVQAVAARTYAAYEIANRTDPRFGLCDDATCQVYGGLSAEMPSTDKATQATAGEVLTYHGQPAFAQFSASNGGWMAAGSEPYLVSKQDPYDTSAVDPYASWVKQVTAAHIAHTWPALGRLTEIEVLGRDGNGDWGGRIQNITLHGTKADRTMTGDDFQSSLGLGTTWLRFSILQPSSRGRTD